MIKVFVRCHATAVPLRLCWDGGCLQCLIYLQLKHCDESCNVFRYFLQRLSEHIHY